MDSARKHARNLSFNTGTHATALVVMLFLSPFVVHSLGTVLYGIWSLINILTGYAGIFDLGIRVSTGRYVILYLGKGDFQRVDETIRTGLGCYTVVGLLVLLVAIFLGVLFPDAFQKVPPEYHTMVAFLLPALAVNLWFTAIRTIDSSVLTAYERFDLARSVDLVVLAVQTGATVAVLSMGWGIVGLTCAIIGANLVGLSATAWLARRVHRQLRHWPMVFQRDRLKELIGFGVASFVSSISVKIIGQSDLLIVGAVLGMHEVGIYSVGAMLLYYSNTLLGQIGRTFFPALQKAAAREEMGNLRWLYLRQARLGGILGILMYVGIIVFARPFINLWMFEPGKFEQTAVDQASAVMMVLAGSKLLSVLSLAANPVLTATGYVRFSAIVTVIEAITNLSLSLLFVLVFGWGLIGVALGTLVARALTSTFWLTWKAYRCMALPYIHFLQHLLLPEIIAGTCFAGACCAMRTLIGTGDWLRFALAVLGASGLNLVISFYILLPGYDRGRILAKLGFSHVDKGPA